MSIEETITQIVDQRVGQAEDRIVSKLLAALRKPNDNEPIRIDLLAQINEMTTDGVRKRLYKSGVRNINGSVTIATARSAQLKTTI